MHAHTHIYLYLFPMLSLVILSHILCKMTIIFAIVNKLIFHQSQRNECSLLHIQGNLIIKVVFKILYQDWQNSWCRKYKKCVSCFLELA